MTKQQMAASILAQNPGFTVKQTIEVVQEMYGVKVSETVVREVMKSLVASMAAEPDYDAKQDEYEASLEDEAPEETAAEITVKPWVTAHEVTEDLPVVTEEEWASIAADPGQVTLTTEELKAEFEHETPEYPFAEGDGSEPLPEAHAVEEVLNAALEAGAKIADADLSEPDIELEAPVTVGKTARCPKVTSSGPCIRPNNHDHGCMSKKVLDAKNENVKIKKAKAILDAVKEDADAKYFTDEELLEILKGANTLSAGIKRLKLAVEALDDEMKAAIDAGEVQADDAEAEVTEDAEITE